MCICYYFGGLFLTGHFFQEFKTGEEVMALWAKNTKYPAKILR
jgi:hypothetical protein